MPKLTAPLHDHDDVFDTACMLEYLITYRSRYLSSFLNAKHACMIHQLHRYIYNALCVLAGN
jgi:hypothetical protein